MLKIIKMLRTMVHEKIWDLIRARIERLEFYQQKEFANHLGFSASEIEYIKFISDFPVSPTKAFLSLYRTREGACVSKLKGCFSIPIKKVGTWTTKTNNLALSYIRYNERLSIKKILENTDLVSFFILRFDSYGDFILMAEFLGFKEGEINQTLRDIRSKRNKTFLELIFEKILAKGVTNMKQVMGAICLVIPDGKVEVNRLILSTSYGSVKLKTYILGIVLSLPDNKLNNNRSIDNISENNLLECSICCDGERDVVFMPCRHYITCLTCSRKLDKCPICRKKIENKIEIIK